MILNIAIARRQFWLNWILYDVLLHFWFEIENLAKIPWHKGAGRDVCLSLVSKLYHRCYWAGSFVTKQTLFVYCCTYYGFDNGYYMTWIGAFSFMKWFVPIHSFILVFFIYLLHFCIMLFLPKNLVTRPQNI